MNNQSVSMDALSKMLALPVVEQEQIGVLHTAREIAQQPDTWSGTYETVKRVQPELQAFLTSTNLFNDVDKRPTVFLIGAGTSDYVSRSVATVIRRMWQCEVWPIPSTDLLTSFDDLRTPGKSYIWISFSRSGDSSEGVAILEAALERRPEIHQLIVCCNQAGRMAQMGNNDHNTFRIVLDDDVNDKGLAMTSSYSNMVVTGQCLAHIHDLETYEEALRSLIATGRKFLPEVAEVTSQLVASEFSKICFLGSGPLVGAAVESALKVTELTAGGIISFSETFLGVRHGPLSAIDSDTLVVGFVSSDQRRRAYEIDLLEEIEQKNLAKNIVSLTSGINAEDLERLVQIGKTLCLDECIDDLYRPPVDVFMGQLMGLFASLKLGLKPDAPSPGGAISRVVTKVKIY